MTTVLMRVNDPLRWLLERDAAAIVAARGSGGPVEDVAAPAQLPAVGVTDYPRSSSRSRPVAGVTEPPGQDRRRGR